MNQALPAQVGKGRTCAGRAVLWVPEMVLTAVDLLLRRWSELATIRR